MTEFVHQAYIPGETIAAIATPHGEGGVAIVRISGKEALDVGDRVFSGDVKSYQSHTAHFGQVVDSGGGAVDDALVLVMLGKRSYTGEDTVEIQCHGGSLITKRVLEVVLEAGARPARPGEFTFRAVMNGRIDLAQAEAVQELIHAKNDYALNAAQNQLEGRLSREVGSFQKELTEIAAILEAWVDFPEEGIEFATMEELCEQLQRLCERMERLSGTFHDGKIVHDGISMCLVGAPNVGKSSLMNALLERERAIVSDTPGTTRDVLEDQLRLNGLNFRLLDTAGIRETDGHIEMEGIRRTQEAIGSADLVLFVMDLSKGVGPNEKQLIGKLPRGKTIAIWNKNDLEHDGHPELDFPHVVSLSAKEKLGIEALHQAIDAVIWEHGPPAREEVVITSLRHKEALKGAIGSCQSVIKGLQSDVSPEFLSMDMRSSLASIGQIIGTNIGEDILSAIFSKFCIGK